MCNEKSRGKLREKAQKLFVKEAETQKDDLITAALSTVAFVWVSGAFCTLCTHPRNVNKTITVDDKYPRDQSNQSFDRGR